MAILGPVTSGVGCHGPVSGICGPTGDSVTITIVPWIRLFVKWCFLGTKKWVCYKHPWVASQIKAWPIWVCQTVRQNLSEVYKWAKVWTSQIHQILPPFWKGGNPHIFIRFLGYLLNKSKFVCSQIAGAFLPTSLQWSFIERCHFIKSNDALGGMAPFGRNRPKKKRKGHDSDVHRLLARDFSNHRAGCFFLLSPVQRQFIKLFGDLVGTMPVKPYKTSFGRDNVPTCLVHEDVGDAKLTHDRISLHLTDVSSKFMRFPTLNLHKSTPQNHEGMVAPPKKWYIVSGSFYRKPRAIKYEDEVSPVPSFFWLLPVLQNRDFWRLLKWQKWSQVWSHFFSHFFGQLKFTCQQNEKLTMGKKTPWMKIVSMYLLRQMVDFPASHVRIFWRYGKPMLHLRYRLMKGMCLGYSEATCDIQAAMGEMIEARQPGDNTPEN